MDYRTRLLTSEVLSVRSLLLLVIAFYFNVLLLLKLAVRHELLAAQNGDALALVLLRQGRSDDEMWKAWARVESAKRFVQHQARKRP